MQHGLPDCMLRRAADDAPSPTTIRLRSMFVVPDGSTSCRGQRADHTRLVYVLRVLLGHIHKLVGFQAEMLSVLRRSRQSFPASAHSGRPAVPCLPRAMIFPFTRPRRPGLSAIRIPRRSPSMSTPTRTQETSDCTSSRSRRRPDSAFRQRRVHGACLAPSSASLSLSGVTRGICRVELTMFWAAQDREEDRCVDPPDGGSLFGPAGVGVRAC